MWFELCLIDSTQAEACAARDLHTSQRNSTQHAEIAEHIHHALVRYPRCLYTSKLVERHSSVLLYFSKSSNAALSVQASSMMSHSGFNWKFNWVTQGFTSAFGSSIVISTCMLSRSTRWKRSTTCN